MCIRDRLEVAAVTQDTTVRAAVGRVPDELLVADARTGVAGFVGGEHGHHGSDLARVGGDPQVLDALVRHLLGVVEISQVPHLQAAPVQPADASRAVAPGNPGAEGQLGCGVPVGAGRRDLRVHFGETVLHRA